MAINIKIEKRDLWIIAAVTVFLFGIVYVIAIGENYAVHGHDHTEINLPACADGQVLKYSGGTWSCNADDTGTPRDCVWEDADRLDSNRKSGYYIAGLRLTGCGRSDTAGCVYSIYWCK